jgi:hypothetical protein
MKKKAIAPQLLKISLFFCIIAAQIVIDMTDNVFAMANPASVNCIDKGGILEIRKNALGEYGVCIFADNKICEEWAIYVGMSCRWYRHVRLSHAGSSVLRFFRGKISGYKR